VLFATVFVLLLLIRFVYMKKTQKSSLPESAPRSQLLAAIYHRLKNGGVWSSMVPFLKKNLSK
jgi:hypothetical protein